MQAWTRSKVEIQPWQAIPERMAELGLTDEDGMAKAWYVSKTGQLSGGAAAVNRAMAHVWWARPFTYLYRLPGIKQLQDRLYDWVAENRYRLPGSQSTCELPPPEKPKKE